MTPSVYSYLRFSTPEQAEGHSLKRQEDYAKHYADKHGLTLNKSLTLKDEGLSAYHQDHIKRGALGLFLKAVEDKLIAPGSILIIECLDRLSRAAPYESQGIMLQLISAGITIVTAGDDKTYSQESLKADSNDMIMSLLILIRAYEESNTKSKRVKASIKYQIDQWITNGRGKVIKNGANPYWVKAREDNSGFDLVDERVVVIKKILELYLQGWGFHKIVTYLNSNYEPFKGKSWYVQYITTLVRSRTLIGERTFTVDDESRTIENYYPSLLTPDEFFCLQKAVKSRASTKGQSKIPSLITGLKTAYCGYCQSSMVAQNYVFQTNKKGNLADGFRRVRCCAHSSGSSCPGVKSVSVVSIERAILEYCSNSMELSAIFGANNYTTDIQKKLIAKQQEQEKIEVQLGNIDKEFLKLTMKGVEVPLRFAQLSEDLRTKTIELMGDIHNLKEEEQYYTRSAMTNIDEEWKQIKSSVYSLDEEARLLIRQLVKRTFKNIKIYLHGMIKSDNDYLKSCFQTDKNSIDLILTFHNDKTRFLSIDKKTGQWTKCGDISVSEENVFQALKDHQLSVPESDV